MIHKINDILKLKMSPVHDGGSRSIVALVFGQDSVGTYYYYVKSENIAYNLCFYVIY